MRRSIRNVQTSDGPALRLRKANSVELAPVRRHAAAVMRCWPFNDGRMAMIRVLSTAIVFASLLLAPAAVFAEAGKAPCGSFQKLPDGKWNVVKAIKIEHGKSSEILNPGTVISPGTSIAGVDIYAALVKSCH
jgi:hypothetical protein